MKLFLFRGLSLRLAGLSFIFAVLGMSSASFAGPVTVTVTSVDGGTLPEAVVYLMAQDRAPALAQEGQSAEMVQRDTTFNPAVLAVQTGTSVSFPNEDPFRHHVYSFSDAKSFELRLYGRREVPSVLFDRPGHVALGCNIHDNMLGHIYIVSTPYFAVSDGQGKITLPDVPTGRYELMTWHPDMRGTPDASAKTVDVTDGGINEAVELRVRRSRRQGDDFERFDY